MENDHKDAAGLKTRVIQNSKWKNRFQIQEEIKKEKGNQHRSINARLSDCSDANRLSVNYIVSIAFVHVALAFTSFPRTHNPIMVNANAALYPISMSHFHFRNGNHRILPTASRRFEPLATFHCFNPAICPVQRTDFIVHEYYLFTKQRLLLPWKRVS